MNEEFKTQEAFTFSQLDFDKLLEIINDYIKKESKKIELYNQLSVKEGKIEKSVSQEEVKLIFESGKFDNINFFIQQARGYGNSLSVYIDHFPNRLSILHTNMNPKEGGEVVASFVSSLKLINIYDSRLLKVKNKSERSYMEEALKCRNSNALRAAIIMAWTCVMHMIYSKIEKKYKVQFITEIKKKNSKNINFKLKRINDLEDYQQFKDKDVLEISKVLFLNKGLATQLSGFLSLRNDCAHVRQWTPTEATVDAFFEEIFNNLYN